MNINTRETRVRARWTLFATALAGLVAVIAWNGRAGEVRELATSVHAQALSAGALQDEPGLLPPGHPPIGQLLPPGHPPVAEAPDDAAPELPPGHPPIGSARPLPPGHPPTGGEHGAAIFEEPAIRDI